MDLIAAAQMTKRFLFFLLTVLCFLLSSCSPAENKAEQNIRSALELICTAPNTAHQELLYPFSKPIEGDGPVAQPEKELQGAYKEALQKLYGACFTPACVERLDAQQMLNMVDILAKPVSAKVEVRSIVIEPQADGQSYDFTVGVTCTAGEKPPVDGKLSGSAQCLPDDGGKISALRLEPSRELLAALGSSAKKAA